MKRTGFVIAVFLLTLSVTSGAQSCYGLRMGVSGLNSFSEQLILSGRDTPYMLGSVYDETGRPRGYGSASLGFVYESGGRFSYAMDLQYSPFVRSITRSRTGAVTGSYICSEMFSLSGIFRWSYLVRPWISMYAGAGPVVFVTRNMPVPLVFFQLNPLCVSAGGQRFRVYLEAGVGSMFTGAQLGVTYLFR